MSAIFLMKRMSNQCSFNPSCLNILLLLSFHQHHNKGQLNSSYLFFHAVVTWYKESIIWFNIQAAVAFFRWKIVGCQKKFLLLSLKKKKKNPWSLKDKSPFNLQLLDLRIGAWEIMCDCYWISISFLTLRDRAVNIQGSPAVIVVNAPSSFGELCKLSHVRL